MQYIKCSPLLFIVLALLGTVSCNTNRQTAAGSVAVGATANPVLVATAQADQYVRDAQATTQARGAQAAALTATYSADLRNVQATAEAGRITASALQAQATATTSVQQTHDALQFALTVGAATTQAQETSTSQARQDNDATRMAGMQATAQAFQATREALAISQAQAATKRDAIIMIVMYSFLAFLAVLTVGLIAWFFVQITPTLITKAGVVTYGQHNNPLLLSAKNGRTVITNPLTMLQASTVIDQEGNIAAPEVTPNEVQTMIAGGAMQVLIEQAKNAPGHPPQLPAEIIQRRQFGHYETETTTRYRGAAIPAPIINLPQPEVTAELHTGLPAEAPWTALNRWSGGGLPLGLGPNGLILLNLETSPHLLIAGTSGSGKTHYGLRPLIATALANHYQVIIIDRSGLDFLPFQNHPNATLVVLTSPTDSICCLRATYEEMQRRFMLLRTANTTTWGQISSESGPRILIIMDEFSNLSDSLSTREREELWRWSRMVAAEGRKAGIHLAIALQDPTHKSLDLRIRRNCTPVAFQVKDKSASNVVLGAPGAEVLSRRHFLVALGELIEGIAFAPSDGEIVEFLQQRHVQAFPSPTWLQDVP